jgi:flagellar assembly protein FliH
VVVMMKWSSDWAVPAEPAAVPAPPSVSWPPAELEMLPVKLRSAAEQDRDERAEAEAQARKQRQAELDEAYERGIADGREGALRSERERVDRALGALAQVMARVEAAQSTWVQDAREHVCALSAAVARHIIGRELRGDVHAMVDLARRALLHFPVDEPVRICLNPEDLSVITAAAAVDAVRVAPGREVEWVADAEILAGGCTVEGRRRLVDGRIDHAIERIYQKLIDD